VLDAHSVRKLWNLPSSNFGQLPPLWFFATPSSLIQETHWGTHCITAQTCRPHNPCQKHQVLVPFPPTATMATIMKIGSDILKSAPAYGLSPSKKSPPTAFSKSNNKRLKVRVNCANLAFHDLRLSAHHLDPKHPRLPKLQHRQLQLPPLPHSKPRTRGTVMAVIPCPRAKVVRNSSRVGRTRTRWIASTALRIPRNSCTTIPFYLWCTRPWTAFIRPF
jgi:hypothetical protein